MLRLTIFLVGLLVLCASLGLAQPLEFEWVTVGDDAHESIPYGGIETAAHEYIIVGSIHPLGPDTTLDALILKLSTMGDELWNRSYDFGFKDAAMDIAMLSDSTFIVGGYATYIPIYVHRHRVLAMWINGDGDSLFTRLYSGLREQYAVSVCPYADVVWLFGRGVRQPSWGQGAYRIKLSAAGDSLFGACEPGGSSNNSGYTDAASSLDWGVVTAYGRNGVIIDPNGNPEYYGSLRTEHYLSAPDPAWLVEGLPYGYWTRNRIALRDDGTSLRLIQTSSTQALVRWYSAAGVVLGDDTLGMYAIDIAVGPDDGWLIVTSVAGAETGSDIQVVGFNAGGQQVLWQTLPLDGDQAPGSIERLSDGSYLIIGTSRLASGDTTYVVAKTNPVVALASTSPPEVPSTLTLYQNYPNPFNMSTVIKFDLAWDVRVRVIIYNTLGRQVATLVDGRMRAGSYQIDWSPGDLPSGIYFCRLTTDIHEQTIKLALLK